MEELQLKETLMDDARRGGICAEGIARISHMDEKWKDIKGFEGVYAISDMGRVYSYRSRRVLKPAYKPEGYPMIRLSKNYVNTIHRLVWDTFVGFTDSRQIINHKNSNKRDCRLVNLEACDYSYNLRYAFENGERATVPVSQYNLQGQFVRDYPSIEDASKITGVQKSCICTCCKGKTKSAGGFVWAYKGESPKVHKTYGRSNRRIVQCDLDGNVIQEWESSYAARHITQQGNIIGCCRGRCKSAGGFIWRYAN